MAKLDGQRPKLLFLLKILNEYTDEEHGISIREIIEKLAAYDVPAERKSIYADMDCLKALGYSLTMTRRRREAYYTLHKRDKQDLTIGELKILVDAVQASRFVSENKSRELIGKLSHLASRYQAAQLRRQVYLANRVKSINESGFKNIDKLHEAINRNKIITFTYLKWTAKKKLVPRKPEPYRVSPWPSPGLRKTTTSSPTTRRRRSKRISGWIRWKTSPSPSRTGRERRFLIRIPSAPIPAGTSACLTARRYTSDSSARTPLPE